MTQSRAAVCKQLCARSVQQNKPLIEKRRRARINECLVQLKQLLMKDMGTEVSGQVGKGNTQ